MQEVLFRERNLRHVEVSMVVSMIEQIGHYLIDALPAPDEASFKKRHAAFSDRVLDRLRLFEAELYEERYLPSYQQKEAEEARKKRIREIDTERRDAKAMKKVALFSQDR
jgi:hypothetical protein